MDSNRQKDKIYLSTKIWFGKYKSANKTMYQVIKEDLNYSDWLINMLSEKCYIDPKVWKMFKELWEQRNHKKYGFRNDNLNKE